MINSVVLPPEFKFRAPLLRMLPPLWIVSCVLFPMFKMSEPRLISRLSVVSPLVAVMLTVELATLMQALEVAPGTPDDQLPAVSQLPAPPFQLVVPGQDCASTEIGHSISASSAISKIRPASFSLAA